MPTKTIADWELAEKLAIRQQLSNPRLTIAIEEIGIDPDSEIARTALQHTFRGSVLSEIEKYEPELVRGATGTVLQKLRKELEGL